MKRIASQRGALTALPPAARASYSALPPPRRAFCCFVCAACAFVAFLLAQQVLILRASIAGVGSAPSGGDEPDSDITIAAIAAKTASTCLHLPSNASAVSPRFEYCQCEAGQEGSFSSPSVENSFLSAYGGPECRGGGGGGPRKGNAENPKMKLLMLAMEREQLTKGRMHLGEAMHLASLLNRTFVLTRVGDSRIGYDRSLPTCSYFDTQKLAQFVDWVSEDLLLPCLQAMPLDSRLTPPPDPQLQGQPSPGPLSLVFLMLIKRSQPCDKTLWKALEPQPGSEGHVISRLLHQALAHGQAQVVCVRERGTRETRIARWNLMQEVQKQVVQEADLVLLFKVGDLMYFYPHELELADAHVVFAPHLEATADNMATTFLAPASWHPPDKRSSRAMQVPPFLAIQWRTEYAVIESRKDPLRLARCVSGLLPFTTFKLKAFGLSRVFLASDLTAQGQPVSNTFFTLPMAHQQAALQSIQKIHQALRPSSWSSVDPAFVYLDNGVQGILDKIVCVRAKVFVSAPRPCGGKSSSFTRSIVFSRKRLGRHFPSQEWPLGP